MTALTSKKSLFVGLFALTLPACVAAETDDDSMPLSESSSSTSATTTAPPSPAGTAPAPLPGPPGGTAPGSASTPPNPLGAPTTPATNPAAVPSVPVTDPGPAATPGVTASPSVTSSAMPTVPGTDSSAEPSMPPDASVEPEPMAAGGAGGMPNTGGSAGAPVMGTGGVGLGPLEGDPTLGGTATRPELSATDAEHFTVRSYLASAGDVVQGLVRDDWDPTAGVGDVSTFVADFTVAASGGTHTTVQQAIDTAVAAGGSERTFVEVEPGTYREVVCVPSGAPPITLFSRSSDAAATTIVFDNYADRPKAEGASANPCNANLSGTTFGTSGSATFASNAREFQAKNLTFSNDTNEAALSGAVQAIALMTQGDRSVFENVRVLGNQDTLSAKTPNVTTVSRTYIKDCVVEGDVDFIFGRGTLVLDGCTIHVLSSRNSNGVLVAPSTDSRNPYGILVTNSTLTAEAGTADNSIHLGRAWDESQVDVATYTANVATGVYPNGQATYRNSTFGAHIRAADPWRAAATTSRPYSSTAAGAVPANRFYEFENTGP